MLSNPVETFLRQSIGLDSASIGVTVLQQLLQAGLRRTGLQVRDYAQFLRHSSAEQMLLIESVVVLETWFFRHRASFEFLVKHLQPYRKQPLRLLSLPCATGEEAYSLAMALLDKGFSADLLYIDAVDINLSALQTARQACYRDSAFREDYGKHLKQRFFQMIQPKDALRDERIYQVKPDIQKLIHWQQGNLLDAHLFTENARFDVIFCRNLLIYLTTETRVVALRNLTRWLKPTGLLFLGHAERNFACHAGFTQISAPNAFACRHPQAAATPQTLAAPPNPLRAALNLRQKPLPAALSRTQPTSNAPPPHNNPEEIYQLLENAQQFADRGELDQALQDCQHFLHIQPDAPQGHFLCALIHQAQRNDTQAERYFQQTLYLQPDHKLALHHLHLLLQRQGRTEQAASLHQRLQRLRGKVRMA